MMGLHRRQLVSGLAWLLGLGLLSTAAPAARAQLYGVDVSHYQGTINWSAVKNSGKTFAFAKATEGTTYTDPTFKTNLAGMKSVGLYRGAYHFGHPGSSATTQADFFCNTVAAANGGNFHGVLQLVLDLEVTDNQPPSVVWSWTQSFIARVKYRTGRPGIIYTGYYFWVNDVGNPTNNLNCPLWLAAYVSNPNSYVPRAWSTWTFWQYTDTGSVPGISGNVDLDELNGTTATLNALTIP